MLSKRTNGDYDIKCPVGYAIDENGLPYKTNRVYGWGKEYNAFVTEYGKYFHKSNCPTLKGKKKILMHRYNAMKYYMPCSHCHPKDYIDSWYVQDAKNPGNLVSNFDVSAFKGENKKMGRFFLPFICCLFLSVLFGVLLFMNYTHSNNKIDNPRPATSTEVTIDGTTYTLPEELGREYEAALKQAEEKNIQTLKQDRALGELWGEKVTLTKNMLHNELSEKGAQYAINEYVKTERNRKKNKKTEEEIQKDVDLFLQNKKRFSVTYDISKRKYAELSDDDKKKVESKFKNGARDWTKKQFYDRIVAEGEVKK